MPDNNERPYLRLIGDVHSHLGPYLQLATAAEYSIQVGDLGFDYNYLLRKKLDPARHRVIAGNHDNYMMDEDGVFFRQTPHFLGNYGVHEVPGFGKKLFFVRGGFSIDQNTRTTGVDWWPEEELDWHDLRNAVELYKQVKPAWVVTHECPSSLVSAFSTYRKEMSPSRTALALEAMFEAHRPARWIFGHHHNTRILEVSGTIFQCLGVLAHADFDRSGNGGTGRHTF